MKVICKRCDTEITPRMYYDPKASGSKWKKSKSVTQTAMIRHLNERHQPLIADIILQNYEFREEVKP